MKIWHEDSAKLWPNFYSKIMKNTEPPKFCQFFVKLREFSTRTEKKIRPQEFEEMKCPLCNWYFPGKPDGSELIKMTCEKCVEKHGEDWRLEWEFQFHGFTCDSCHTYTPFKSFECKNCELSFCDECGEEGTKYCDDCSAECAHYADGSTNVDNKCDKCNQPRCKRCEWSDWCDNDPDNEGEDDDGDQESTNKENVN